MKRYRVKTRINPAGFYEISTRQIPLKKQAAIRAMLEMNPYVHGGKFRAKSFNILIETADYFFLPRGFGQMLLGAPLIHKIPPAKRVKMPMKSIALRDYQIDAIGRISAAFHRKSRGGILKMPTGTGKTFTSLALAGKLGLRTLIILDKDPLCDQWIAEIRRLFNLEEIPIFSRAKTPEESRKILRGNYPIVVTVNKSIVTRQYLWRDYADFGLVIIDEVHKFMTAEIVKMFNKISCTRFILGLTATPDRADHMHVMLPMYIGPILYEVQSVYTGKLPVVHRYDYHCLEPAKYARILKNDAGNMLVTEMYKRIAADPHREKFLCEIIEKYRQREGVMIVIGLFRSQLERLRAKIPDSCIYYGETNAAKKAKMFEEIRRRKIILAIRQMGSESLNIPDATTLILASSYIPRNDGENVTAIQQQVGRILRKNHEKSPVIVDIADTFAFFARHARLREEFYRDCGYKMEKKITD